MKVEESQYLSDPTLTYDFQGNHFGEELHKFEQLQRKPRVSDEKTITLSRQFVSRFV
jgi:hypothetical protein